MTPKWKKRGLCLIFPILLGSVISSVVATEWHGRIGKLGFKYSKTLKNQLNQFIQASNKQGGKTSSQNITANDLISKLAQNPNSVPLLMVGFATQIAKSIFDGDLFKGTKHEQTIGKNFSAFLKGPKKQAEQAISSKRKVEKRVKRDWSSDDERYLSGLKEFVLGQINSGNIDNYYHQEGHKWATNKSFQGEGKKKILTFIGFLLAKWIGKSQVGRFIHEILPYANRFQDSTTELYNKKYKNVNLPSKPNFHFPDFNPSDIEKFKDAINLWAGGEDEGGWKNILLGPNKEKHKKELKEKSYLHWISKDNTSQKNLALKLLTQESKPSSSKSNGDTNNKLSEVLSWLWGSVKATLRPHLKGDSSYGLFKNDFKNENGSIPTLTNLWQDLKQDPLKLFRISSDSEKSQSSTNVEFLIHSPSSTQNSSEKIIFWRDDKGFNLLFPVTKTDIENSKGGSGEKEESNEQFHKSKERLVEQFKDYVKENFPYLLLKYYLHIKGCDSGATPPKPQDICCCKEIIENLIQLWELSTRLKELNESLKVWDHRAKNNSSLSTVDYSQQSSSYLSKLGTISANPPTYLSKVSHESEIKKLNSSIKDHLKKVGEYFQENSKQGGAGQLKMEQKSGTEENKEHKYWTFNSEDSSQKKTQEPKCMKKSVAEFLLEKNSTLDLLKNHILLSISFDKITDLLQENGQSKSSDKPSLKKLEGELSKSYNGFFNFANGTGTSGGGVRARRQAPTSPSSTNNNLLSLLLQAIKDEIVVSNLGSISDTLLYKLSKENTNGAQLGQADSSTHFETIKDWLTVNALLGQPLRKINTLENAQLRLLITALYLLENSLKEYREILKSIIKSDFFGSYVFSLSWNKFCTPDKEKNPFDPDKSEPARGDSVSQSTNGKTNFWSPIDPKPAGQQQQTSNSNQEEWSATSLDPRACIKNSDRFSIAEFKKKKEANGGESQDLSSSVATNSENMKLMGYKGSISRGSQVLLPGNLYEKILNFLLKEGHITWQQIESQVDLIKSNSQFSNFITQLTKVKSSIGQAFELPDYRKIKEDLDQSKRAEALEWLGLKQKTELLKKFIKEHLFSGDTDSSLKLTQTSSTSDSTTSQTNKNDRKSFRGLMWDRDSTDSKQEGEDGKKYIFSTKDENEGSALIYLIQYTHEDLKNETSFAKFLQENLTPDMLIRDIVKKAHDKGLQSKAINHYLMRGSWATGDKVFNLKSNDYYLKDQFSSIIL